MNLRAYFSTSISLLVRAEAEQGDGRAPALDGVLEQEYQDGRREQPPFPVYCRSQYRAGEGQGRGIEFEESFDVPLVAEFLDAFGDVGL